jgi:hypothetical protein
MIVQGIVSPGGVQATDGSTLYSDYLSHVGQGF